jgi:hypothetical protein
MPAGNQRSSLFVDTANKCNVDKQPAVADHRRSRAPVLIESARSLLVQMSCQFKPEGGRAIVHIVLQGGLFIQRFLRSAPQAEI